MVYLRYRILRTEIKCSDSILNECKTQIGACILINLSPSLSYSTPKPRTNIPNREIKGNKSYRYNKAGDSNQIHSTTHKHKSQSNLNSSNSTQKLKTHIKNQHTHLIYSIKTENTIHNSANLS